MTDFLVIGHRTAGSLDCVFELLIKDKLRFGFNGLQWFIGSECGAPAYWYTSLSREECEFADLVEYHQEDYETIGMTKIINIERVDNIPDYPGVMAVPVTFLKKWNPKQFEIVGKTGGGYRYKDYVKREILTNDGLWGRIFIKKK